MNNTDKHLEVARRFLKALNENNGDEVRAIYHPDAIIWHNIHADGYQSIEENIKTLNWMHRKMPKLNYDIVRLESLSNGYLQQHVLRGEMENGTKVELYAGAIITVEDGRIVKLEEYLDPSQVAALQS